MCRLCAMTACGEGEGLGQTMRALAMHNMLITNNADRTPQRDGWGVTDGVKIFKAGGSYRAYDPEPWMREIDHNRMWMGHLRNASAGTSLSDTAAHPFEMKHFIGMHNGNMTGTWSVVANKVPEGSPNSDSWRAFHKLDLMLDEGPALEEIVDQWLSLFEHDSAFVMMLMHNQALHIIRGPKTRDLYYAPYDTGFIFNTDQEVLKGMRAWMSFAGGVQIGEIKEFPELHYARLLPNTNEFQELRDLKYEPKKVNVTTYGTNSAFQSSSYNRTVASTQKKGRWMRVTKVENEISAEDEAKLKLWLQFRQNVYPLRDFMALEFAKFLLERQFDDHTELANADFEKLDALVKACRFNENTRKIILEWNARVPEDDEPMLYYTTFAPNSGSMPFWMLRNGMDIVKEITVEGGQP